MPADRHGILDSVLDTLAPVHREGHKFIGIALAVALLGAILWSPLMWLGLAAALFIAFFFRDPDRVTPLREGLLIAPADGRISAIEKVRPPAELGFTDGAERVRVSIFLSVLDVHINRAPVAGRISRSVYVPGAFLNAAMDKASDENERRALVVTTPAGVEVGVVQIAGLIARRIVTFAHEGDTVGVGQRFGLIRFGSRVDLYLPPGKSAQAIVGQWAVGGETVLADLKSEEGEREGRRG